MTKEFKILAIKNRISLLESRAKKDNANIIRKLKRKLNLIACTKPSDKTI